MIPDQIDPDTYLADKLREYRQRIAEAPLRPRKPQDGHTDLPLFQTDIEEFTRADN